MNSVIIDTQVLIWWLSAPKNLKARHLKLLEDPNTDIDVSICSLFEITFKKSLGKIQFDFDMKEVLESQGFKILPIHYVHLDQYLLLPPIHKDPFDRMIIAQAIAENKPVISYDKSFSEYDVVLI